MDPVDDKLRAAMTALEAGVTPRGYFDELAGRIDARLEGSMQMSENDHGADSTGVPPMERTEDSGVHDIKALARSTRQRISRRQTSQHDIDESLLSSSQSGMHAIALPDPAKMIALPTPEEAKALSQSMSMRAVDDPGAPAVAHEPMIAARKPDKSRGVPVWLWAGGGIAAAAAAVVAFVTIGKGSSADDKAPAASQAAGSNQGTADLVASRDEVAPPMKAEEQADPGVTVTGIADANAVTAGTGMAAGSGAVAEVAADPSEAVHEGDKDATGDARKKEHHSAGSGSGSGSSSGSSAKVKPDGDGKGSSKAPPDDKGGGKTKGSGGGAGSGTGSGGAVLGAGDDDELGIGDAIKGGGSGGADDDKPKKTELTSKELRAGLDAVLGKAKACYDGAVGTVKVKLTVASTGKVTKASASGDLAGTPAASCVVDAIKGAEFPAWTGAPMSTTYAVLLSD